MNVISYRVLELDREHVCFISKQPVDQPLRPAHSFVEKIPLLLIQKEQVVSNWLKNGHSIRVNCLLETCPGTVWLSN